MNLSDVSTTRLNETAELLRQPTYGKQVEFFEYKQLTDPVTQSVSADVLGGDGVVGFSTNLSEIETELERRKS